MKHIYSSKKTVATIMLLSLTIFSAFAQLPNAGYETWTGNEVNGWVSTNGLTLLGNPQSVFKSTDAHSGAAACEINTVRITNKPPGVFIPDYAGSVFTGVQSFTTSQFGFPYTYKPSTFSFWYKYNAQNSDTASAIVFLSRWNTTTNKRDTIAFGVGLMKDAITTYTKNSITLMVMDATATPDTATILFSSSSLNATQAGAKLVVDDLELTGGNVGFSETVAEVDFSVFPNPAKASSGIFVKLNADEKSAEVTLTTLQGKLVHTQFITNTAQQLNTQGLPQGYYFISVQTANGKAVKKVHLN